MELNAKRLEILKEAVPEAVRIGALWNPANPIHGPSLKVIEAAARRLKVQLDAMAVRDPQDLPGAFLAMTQERVQALTVPPDGMFLAHQARIIDLAAKHRIPSDVRSQGSLRGWWPDRLSSEFAGDVPARGVHHG